MGVTDDTDYVDDVVNSESEKKALGSLKDLVKKHNIASYPGNWPSAVLLREVTAWVGEQAESLTDDAAGCFTTWDAKMALDIAWKIRLAQNAAKLILFLQRAQLEAEKQRIHVNRGQVERIGAAIRKTKDQVLNKLAIASMLTAIVIAAVQVGGANAKPAEELAYLLSAKSYKSCLRSLLSMAFKGGKVVETLSPSDILGNGAELTSVERCAMFGCAVFYVVLEIFAAQGAKQWADFEDAVQVFALQTVEELGDAMNATLYCWMIEHSAHESQTMIDASYVEQAVRCLARMDLSAIFQVPEEKQVALDVFYPLRCLQNSQPPRVHLASVYLSSLTIAMEPDESDEAELWVKYLLDCMQWNSDEEPQDDDQDELWKRQWHHLIAVQRKIITNRDTVLETVFHQAWVKCQSNNSRLCEIFLRTPFNLSERKYVELFLTRRTKSIAENESQKAYDLLVAFYSIHYLIGPAQKAHEEACQTGTFHAPRENVRKLLIQKQVEECIPPHLNLRDHYYSIFRLGDLLATLPGAVSKQSLPTFAVPGGSPSKSQHHMHLDYDARKVDEANSLVAPPRSQPSDASAQSSFFKPAPTKQSEGPKCNKIGMRRRSSPKHTQIYTRQRRAMPMPSAAGTSKGLVLKRGADTSPSVHGAGATKRQPVAAAP
eukprot:CAMPEP_0184550610 /NCGR_PEP_ID=MMETSP0199_2-20130426/21050_1 /TAXON_ID=1112570 /ORGANISM="Thraustochytrium sp., Strain LLF1b" /LENGTH=657 /DNA_ID=CAMNT_0026945537 /DNA_START=262 /DNA_END=2232 /DNA_ORIENTATION=-